MREPIRYRESGRRKSTFNSEKQQGLTQVGPLKT